MKIRFTEHAIQRFIERVRPDLGYGEALDEMNELATEGRFLREKTEMGDAQLLCSGVVFVLKHDKYGQHDCATVLFDKEDGTNELALEIARYESEPLTQVRAPLRRRRRSRKNSRWN